MVMTPTDTIYGVIPMNVAYSFSPNWFKYILIELFALFSHHNKPITVYLLSDPLTKWQIKQLKILKAHFNHLHKIEVVAIPDNTFKELNSGQFTKYALYRLLLPFIVEVDKILYLDADTLVLQNLEELYNMELGNNYLAAAEDKNIDYWSPNLRKAIGFTQNDVYINSGVTLLNLKLLRETKKADELFDTIQTVRYPVCPDQTLLNHLCKNQIALIDRYYNACYATFLEEPMKFEKIKILHYIGNKNTNWVYDMELAEVWNHWETKYREMR